MTGLSTPLQSVISRDGGRARKPTDSEIYRHVYGAIVDHRLPPGTKLPEDALAEIFGVSRTRIRKVLHGLGHENIVKLEPNRGAFVAQPSVREAREVFIARRLIESGIIRDAALSVTRGDIKELDGTIAAERAAAERNDKRGAIKLSGEFHLKLAEVAGNQTLTRFLRQLVSRTSLIIAVYEVPGRSACHYEEHDQLVRLLASRESDAAAAAMQAHLSSIEASLNLEKHEPAAINLKEVFAEVMTSS